MTEPMETPAPPDGQDYGSWLARVGAAILDGLPIGVAYAVLAVAFGDNVASDGTFSTNLSGWPAALFFALTLAWIFYNWGMRQGATGQTFGKSVTGVAVYKAGTTEPLGTGLSFGRYFVHIIDALPCYVGYLWPLWDKENRTFTDMVMSTRVYKK